MGEPSTRISMYYSDRLDAVSPLPVDDGDPEVEYVRSDLFGAAVAERTEELEAQLRCDTGELWVDECKQARGQRDDLARRLAVAREALNHYGWDDPTDDGTIARKAIAAIDAPAEK